VRLIRACFDTTKKRKETDRGCVRSTSRSGTAATLFWDDFNARGHPHALRLVLRTSHAPLLLLAAKDFDSSSRSSSLSKNPL